MNVVTSADQSNAKPLRHLGKAAPHAASDVRQVSETKRRISKRMSQREALLQHRAGCLESGLASIAKAGNIWKLAGAGNVG
jgi:hypothetical protein